MENFFKKVLLIGSGKIACNCLKTLLAFDISPYVLEYKGNNFSQLKYLAKKENVAYQAVIHKQLMNRCLLPIRDNTLVISANNTYLFPKEICENKKLLIVNFHNALLPKYPGQNGATWAIFYGERIGGITWHIVNSGIDTGDIIIQKECEIGEHTTALQLVSLYMYLGKSAFEEILPDLLANRIKARPQEHKGKLKTFKLSELPADGKIDLNERLPDIYRLLRSMDYGKSMLMPFPQLSIHNEFFSVVKYTWHNETMQKERIILDGDILKLSEDNMQLILTLKNNREGGRRSE